MNTAKKIEAFAAENDAPMVVRGNNRLALEYLAEELEIDISGGDVNDDMLLEAMAEVLAEESE